LPRIRASPGSSRFPGSDPAGLAHSCLSAGPRPRPSAPGAAPGTAHDHETPSSTLSGPCCHVRRLRKSLGHCGRDRVTIPGGTSKGCASNAAGPRPSGSFPRMTSAEPERPAGAADTEAEGGMGTDRQTMARHGHGPARPAPAVAGESGNPARTCASVVAEIPAMSSGRGWPPAYETGTRAAFGAWRRAKPAGTGRAVAGRLAPGLIRSRGRGGRRSPLVRGEKRPRTLAGSPGWEVGTQGRPIFLDYYASFRPGQALGRDPGPMARGGERADEPSGAKPVRGWSWPSTPWKRPAAEPRPRKNSGPAPPSPGNLRCWLQAVPAGPR